MINIRREDGKSKITAEITALVLAMPSKPMEDLIAAHLTAIKPPTKTPMESDLAIKLAQMLLAEVRESPERCLKFVKFYGVDKSDPQCDIELSDGTIHVRLLGGLDDETGTYIVSEFDQDKVAKNKLEIRSIREKLCVIDARLKDLRAPSIAPFENAEEFA